MGAEIVTAVYRPKPGKDAELAALVAKHVPLLRAEGYATEREPIVMRSHGDGTIVEVFEWVRGGASAKAAHENPAVAEIWGAMEEVADFVTLGDLAEAGAPFPHFEPV